MKELEIRRASAADRMPVYRMLELYQHDLSDIWDQDLDTHGVYGYELDRYWGKEDCHAYVALVDGKHAGFALADTAVKIEPAGHWMDQFFVLKKYRRRGVGADLAVHVFAELPGHWEVGQMPNNIAAQAFWRSIIGVYTDGRFSEQRITRGWWQGLVQSFESPSKP